MTQQAYLRIRALEESYQTFDYMCQFSNPGLAAYLIEEKQEEKNKTCKKKHIVS